MFVFFVALSSSADDSILSSLNYHLPNTDSDKGDKLFRSGSTSVSQDGGRDASVCSDKNAKGENFQEINLILMKYAERNEQQHFDDPTEDQAASVEVILQPFDESDDDNDDDMDKEWVHNL